MAIENVWSICSTNILISLHYVYYSVISILPLLKGTERTESPWRLCLSVPLLQCLISWLFHIILYGFYAIITHISLLILHFLRNGGNNMPDVTSCEVEATLAPLQSTCMHENTLSNKAQHLLKGIFYRNGSNNMAAAWNLCLTVGLSLKYGTYKFCMNYFISIKKQTWR
jgi:hypothetical protein